MMLMSQGISFSFYWAFYYSSGEFYQRKCWGCLIYKRIPAKRKGKRKSFRDIYRRDILRKNKHNISSGMRLFRQKSVKKKDDNFSRAEIKATSIDILQIFLVDIVTVHLMNYKWVGGIGNSSIVLCWEQQSLKIKTWMFVK